MRALCATPKLVWGCHPPEEVLSELQQAYPEYFQ